MTKQMTKDKTGRWRRWALGGALAALLAAGAMGAGVAGDPSQWGRATAGDPSQWGRTAGDPSQWGRGGQLTLNFTKIELRGTAAVGVERAGTRVGTSPGSRDSTLTDPDGDTASAGV